MNCCREVLPGDGKIFAEVFVCPDCYVVAERLYQRAHQVLKLVLVMMKDTIRLSLLQRRLSFKSSAIETMTKSQLLGALSKLVDAGETCDPTTPSTESTKLSVDTVDSD